MTPHDLTSSFNHILFQQIQEIMPPVSQRIKRKSTENNDQIDFNGTKKHKLDEIEQESLEERLSKLLLTYNDILEEQNELQKIFNQSVTVFKNDATYCEMISSPEYQESLNKLFPVINEIIHFYELIIASKKQTPSNQMEY